MSHTENVPQTGFELFAAWLLFMRWNPDAARVSYVAEEHTKATVLRRHLPLALSCALGHIPVALYLMPALPAFALFVSGILSSLLATSAFMVATARH